MIVGLLGIAMLASPLTATMYLPLLPALSKYYRVSMQAINLTITIYIIFQAVAPLLLASTSDYFGRRPIYLCTFALYTVACLGLALNTTSYGALLVLRAIQSLGASAILSVSYGTVADISVTAERGKFLGLLLTAANVGTSIGPVFGGLIVYKSGSFRWAFWALVVFGAFMLIALALVLPETARNVVGNGKIRDRRWNQPIWTLLREHCNKKSRSNTLPEVENEPTHRVKLTSPIASLRVIFYADTCLIIWIGSSFYALWYCIQASIPSIYKGQYSFNALQTGLAYLPGSVGVILGMYFSGKAIDYNYKHTARKLGLRIDKVKGDDLAEFPIEDARTKGCAYLLVLSLGIMVGYGWSVQKGVHVAAPLIFQFAQGLLSTWICQCYSILLVDGFPQTPSTAATAGNMTRCVLSAIAVAVLEPFVHAVGYGWFMAFLGLLTGIGGLLAQVVLRKWGRRWRNARTKETEESQSNRAGAVA